jgi:hypothetical protein
VRREPTAALAALACASVLALGPASAPAASALTAGLAQRHPRESQAATALSLGRGGTPGPFGFPPDPRRTRSASGHAGAAGFWGVWLPRGLAACLGVLVTTGLALAVRIVQLARRRHGVRGQRDARSRPVASATGWVKRMRPRRKPRPAPADDPLPALPASPAEGRKPRSAPADDSPPALPASPAEGRHRLRAAHHHGGSERRSVPGDG